LISQVGGLEQPVFPQALPAQADSNWRDAMLRWALIFLVVALIAGVLGFGGIAGASMQIAQVLFFVFVVLFVVSLIAHLVRGRGV
jgi:uncharacterized membrane protein YtjA (UPF0391 family)